MNTKTLYIFRGVALVTLLILVTKPVMKRSQPSQSGDMVVLVDTSRSMRVKEGKRRLEMAKEALKAIAKENRDIKIFQFGAEVMPVSTDQVESLEPRFSKSDMGLALKNSISSGTVRAVVILSDGRHVGPGDPVSTAASIGRPLLTVGIGDMSLFKDIAVRAVQGPPFAFKGVPTALSATVTAVGLSGKSIVVKLKEGDRILSLQNVTPQGTDFETTVTFSWTPTTIGSKLLTVEATAFPEEVTAANNTKDVRLDVGRDRFRVLYICGQPGPEYGFLRYQFKSDPAVELVTFVILRNATNVLSVPDAELSLIPFPSQDMLINQMSTFDLMVFDEFSYREFGLDPSLLLAVRRRVEEGGSFLITGGPVAFGPGSFYSAPGVQEMIPVNFGTADVRTVKGPLLFIPRIPNHPVMRLEEDSTRNGEEWKQLAPLEDVTLVPSAKSGANVLGTVEVDGKSYPVLTVWRLGKGRVAALTARTTWRWSMIPGVKDQGAHAYQQFWKNMVLWLTHSDEYKTVRLGIEGTDVKMGEPTAVRVWVYDEYFKPVDDADVKIQATQPDNQELALQAHLETTGVFLSSFNPAQTGEYRLKTWVFRKGKRYGEDALRVRVIESQLEEEDLRPDFSLLKDMAEASGGMYVTAKEFNADAYKEFERRISEKVSRKVLVWNSKWLFGLVALLLIVEWIFRKRRGLP